MRISDGSKRAIFLIAASDDLRDTFLSALRLRVAPWNILRVHMKEELSAAQTPPSASLVCASVASKPSLADAAREFFADGTGGSAVEMKARTESMARRVWEKAGAVAEASIWSATFAQGLGGAVKTAEEVERLAKPLGGLTVVGCAFSLVALSARAVSLIALESEGRGELFKAEGDLREASVLLMGWLFSILGSGFQDQDGLVDRVFGVVEECWQVAKELEEYMLRTRVARVWSAEDVHAIVTKAGIVNGKLFGVGLLKVVSGVHDQFLDHEVRIIDLEASSVDHFRVPSQTLIEQGVGLLVGAATCLHRLKSAVLPSRSSAAVCARKTSHASSSGRKAEGASPVALVSISGEGGVGKTSTCRLLCLDDDVREHFSGGAIVWIDVGKNATEEKVKDEIRRVISKFGGKRSAQEVRSAKDVLEAVEIARDFFAGKCVLVVIDNVWDTPVESTVESWTSMLANIASHSGSAVVATTRLSSLARGFGFDQLNLGRLDLTSDTSPDWRVAEDLYDEFLKSSGELQTTTEYNMTRRKALSLSCGLFLGIRTIASIAHSYHDIGDSVDDVLLKIEGKALGLSDRAVGANEKASVGHPGLFAAMEESLTFLDDKHSCHVKSKPVLPRSANVSNSSYTNFADRAFSSRYAALHMLEASSTSITFPLLRRLWHLATIDEAKAIVVRFVDIGLGRVEGTGQKCFVLHDLQYEFCCLFSKSCSSVGLPGGPTSSCASINGHALFLSSCKSFLFSEYGEANVALWARFCFGDLTSSDAALGKYLSNNLLRHLCSAVPNHSSIQSNSVVAFAREIMSVLCSFRWLRGRFTTGGRKSVLQDFTSALEVGVLCDVETDTLRKLLETLMLVCEDANFECDGSLAGSLVQLAQSAQAEKATSFSTSTINFFTELAGEAAEEVLGAWLKPVSGCCRSFEHGFLGKASISSTVRFVSSLGDEVHFVSLSRDGKVRIHAFSYIATALVLEGIGRIQSIAVVYQRHAECSPFIFTGAADGKLLRSSIALNEAGTLCELSRNFVGESGSSIFSVSTSRDGSVVAAGCWDGSVHIWELEGGDTGSYVLIDKFICSEAGSKESFVKSVVVSGGGRFVAACTLKGDLALWKGEDGGSDEGVGLARRTFEGKSFKSMFLSNDDSILIALFDNPARYEFWNVDAGVRRSSLADLPALSSVYCANLAAGNNGYAFGKSLLVGGWDQDACEHVLVEYLIGDKLNVMRKCCLSTSPSSLCSAGWRDGVELSRIVLGYWDGSVGLLGDDSFDGSSKSDQRDLFMKGDGGVILPKLTTALAVAVMPQAGLVVAGHTDGRLSLWLGEDGSFLRLIDGKREVGLVACIEISIDESVVISGHEDGTALVWDSSSWTVRCALEGRPDRIACVAVYMYGNRVFTVDRSGKLCVWDARRGGAALSVIETGLKFIDFKTRAFCSPDGELFMWVSGGPDRVLALEPWVARVVSVSEGRVICESDNHFKWDLLCADLDSRLSHADALESWKSVAVSGDGICKLDAFVEGDGKFWEIYRGGRSRVRCVRRSEFEFSRKASLCFDSDIYSVAARWLPKAGGGGYRHAIVACAHVGKSFPAIILLIVPTI